MAGRLYHLYCDESSDDKAQSYMILGGIMLPGQLAWDIRARIQAWRERENMKSELKWVKVSRQKYREYSTFVRGTMRYIKQRALWFRCLVLERRHLDYHAFHEGSEGLGYNRFLYQLVIHGFMPFLYAGDELAIFIDERRSTHPLSELQACLNKTAARKFRLTNSPVVKIEPVSSKMSHMMQMADLLLGAVGHQNNRREEVPGRSQAKVDLAGDIATWAGLPHLRVNTPPSMTHFNIWQFKLEQKKRPRS